MLSSRNLKAALPWLAPAAILFAIFSLNSAQASYPERIIKIVVPFAPGGGTDVVARTLAQEMAKDLAVSVIVENKPGAGTIIGTQAVATPRLADDGETQLPIVKSEREKLGRNEPCWCGSGKKFKLCHGAN